MRPSLGLCSPRKLVLVHPPSVSKRYLPTRFVPHGMATLYAGLAGLGLPVVQCDRLMDSLYADEQGLDVHGRDRGLPEAAYWEFLKTGRGQPRLEAFVARHLDALPGDGGIYGFSVVSYHQFHAAMLLISELARRRPQVVSIVGGPFVTVKDEAFISRHPVAYLRLRGCGIPGLAAACRGHDLAGIPGLSRPFPNAAIGETRPPAPAEDEPAPDFAGLDLGDYRYDHPELGKVLFLPYRTAKGCPAACSFCTGRLADPFSPKSPGKVLCELDAMTRRYESKAVMFTDAAVNARPRDFSRLCRLLSRELPGLRWYAYARVGGFSEKMAEEAARAGCFALFFGVESAHAPTIRLLGKGFRPEQARAALTAASRAGIKAVAHLMYNTPHESEADLAAMTDLVESFAADPLVEFMPQRFLLEPGTRMFAGPARFGLANVRLLPGGLFERQEAAYDLADGTPWETVRERQRENRRILSPLLDRLEGRVFPKDAGQNRLARELM